MLGSVQIQDYRRAGALAVQIDAAPIWSAFLSEQLERLFQGAAPLRPWHFFELHNPWSRAAAWVDSWSFLDICQSKELLAPICALLGDDVILFDSQILPNAALPPHDVCAWQSDDMFFPVASDAGVVARLPFGRLRGRAFSFRSVPDGCASQETRLTLAHGDLVLHQPAVRYRTGLGSQAGQFEYVIRYFAATQHYVREPSSPKQLRLMETYPWINYAKMPLWLVSGEDRANNDFVTGFQSKTGRWTAARTDAER